MKTFDFEDEELLNDVLNTEKLLLNEMPANEPVSNLRPLSKLMRSNFGEGNNQFNFAVQLSNFLKDKSNQSSLTKKQSVLARP